jgi:hypothetical protein
MNGNVGLRGYIQSARYFQNYRAEIADLFYPVGRRKIIPYCGINIRRTDYVELKQKEGNWNIPPPKYYIDIIERFNKKCNGIFRRH